MIGHFIFEFSQSQPFIVWLAALIRQNILASAAALWGCKVDPKWNFKLQRSKNLQWNFILQTLYGPSTQISFQISFPKIKECVKKCEKRQKHTSSTGCEMVIFMNI